MLYVITQWGGAGPTQLTTAQRLQNKMARWITGHGKRTKISILLEDLGWLSMREMEKIHSITQMWKIINLKKPETIREKLEVTTDSKIQIRPPRLQSTLNAFTWRTADIWNQMPLELRELKSLPSFKRRLKKWIYERRNCTPD